MNDGSSDRRLTEPSGDTGEGQVGDYGKLHGFIYASGLSVSPTQKAFGSHIRADYYYASLSGDEMGSLGFDEDETKYTTTYTKLF
jgi:hypothetical protein